MHLDENTARAAVAVQPVEDLGRDQRELRAARQRGCRRSRADRRGEARLRSGDRRSRRACGRRAAGGLAPRRRRRRRRTRSRERVEVEYATVAVRERVHVRVAVALAEECYKAEQLDHQLVVVEHRQARDQSVGGRAVVRFRDRVVRARGMRRARWEIELDVRGGLRRARRRPTPHAARAKVTATIARRRYIPVLSIPERSMIVK